MTSLDARGRLQQARETFRGRMAPLDAPSVWAAFSGTIGVVLAGGGARGAYEAGSLLAFQDAGLPIDLITATSIGSINGASFAAYAEGRVGNAEPLVSAWFDLTPPTVGVEWTRYVWMLGGMLAMFAGVANLTYYLLDSNGYPIHLAHPALAWASLSLAGVSVLLFYDHLPYVFHVVHRLLHRSTWRPDNRRLLISISANLLVLSFIAALVESLRIEATFREMLSSKPLLMVVILAGLFALQRARRRLHPGFGRIWGRLLRLPFRTGIFSNFERTRHLRRYIPVDKLRTSAIRVVLASTDLTTGAARYFTNAEPSLFLDDSGVDRRFVADYLVRADDLMAAVIASSALPIAYEPLALGGKLHADGAIVGNQPVRPAIRLGADVLFLVSMEEPGGFQGELHTFVDVGLRALEILMQQNVQADLALLRQTNLQIEEAARGLGARPEDLVIELEKRRFRYLKAYAIHPSEPIHSNILDFGGRATEEAIVRGYLDAAEQVENFAHYARGGGFGRERRALLLKVSDPSGPERLPR